MSAPTLLDVQRWMKSQIRPGGPPAAHATQGLGATLLQAQRGTLGVERLSVYAGGYQARTHEALLEVYEAVRHVVGASVFARLSHDYTRRYPSQDYNLTFTGRHFPEFLKTASMINEWPFLADLAKLEWAVCQALHAFEQPPLHPGTLAALGLPAWDRTRVVFQPSVGLISSAWPILEIWDARTQPLTTVQIRVVDRPQRVLVFRQDIHVRCTLVEEQPATVLAGLLAGQTLGAVCHDLTERFGPQPLPITQWFAEWMQAGLIIRCDAP